jgi:hypothetical protein
MKTMLLTFALVASAAIVVLAQGRISSGSWRKYQDAYDAKSEPPITLAEAHSMALAYIGTNSNNVYCVSASCLEKTGYGMAGWTMWFARTNGQRGIVCVSFDKEVLADANSTKTLRGQ